MNVSILIYLHVLYNLKSFRTKKSVAGDNSDDRSIRRNLMHMLRMSGEQDVPRINTSTQTPGVRRSASTQTDTDDSM